MHSQDTFFLESMIPETRTNNKNQRNKGFKLIYLSLDEERRRIGEEYSVRETESVSLYLFFICSLQKSIKVLQYIKILSAIKRRIIVEMLRILIKKIFKSISISIEEDNLIILSRILSSLSSLSFAACVECWVKQLNTKTGYVIWLRFVKHLRHLL